MKIFITCFAVIFLASFTEPTYQYPDFMVRYDIENLPGKPAIEGFSNGEFVPGGIESFMQGIDSVAVKYIVNSGTPKFKTVYTNFYSRTGNNQWKKYGADKKLIGIITEHRDQTGITQSNVIYYRVY